MIPFKYNLRNLIVRWRTTALTAVGFTLIVALLMVMLGFVEGINELARRSGPPGNVIVLREGAADELFSEIPASENNYLIEGEPEVVTDPVPDPARPGETKAQPRVSYEVYSVAPQEVPAKVEGDPPSFRFLQIRGVRDAELSGRVHGLTLQPGGRWFDPLGADASGEVSGEVVLGAGMARLLGLAAGDELRLRPGLVWRVAGVMDSRGSPFDSEIWAKLDTVANEFGRSAGGKLTYSSIVVTTGSVQEAQALAADLKVRTALERTALLESKYYEELSKGNQLFLYAALFIAAVMAVGGMFGLMNTMFAAVSQRIKDIGVLRVLGFTKGQILVSFLLESLLLAVLGGALGIGLGMLLNGTEQTGVMSSGQGPGRTVVFKIAMTPLVVSVAVGFTLLMGLLGGLLPSFTAMRMKVLDTLR